MLKLGIKITIKKQSVQKYEWKGKNAVWLTLAYNFQGGPVSIV